MRPADAQDVPAMVDIIVSVAEERVLGVEPPVDAEARAEMFQAIIDGSGPAEIWVLEDRGTIVGQATLEPARARGVLTLGMAILPEGRGRRGGRMLIDTIVEHARSAGAHKLELEVWPENGRAVALYARAGFTVEGLRRAHYRRRDGSLRGSLIMARLLIDGEEPAGGGSVRSPTQSP